MDKKIITAQQLYNLLLDENILNYIGQIKFKFGNIETVVTSRDIVGNCLQEWLKQWLINNNYYYHQPQNTQVFPDFYLHPTKLNTNMLELKTFNIEAFPSFDVANFDSYCQTLKTQLYVLDADYLIIGYSMNINIGYIQIKNIWLKKIWQIVGSMKKYALNVQIKKNIIYNIRPIKWYSSRLNNSFNSKEEFIKAIYLTLKDYKGQKFANDWLYDIQNNYKSYYGKEIKY